MSALEDQLIGAAFRGEWAGPSKLPYLASLSPPQQADITIEGAFLRQLVLDLVASPPPPPRKSPQMYGVRLRGAIIKGEIDLSDCTGWRGAPLPPLLLECCIIRAGDLEERNIVCENTLVKQKIRRAINATNARLSRLSLNGCRVDGRIDLTGAKLDGDLEINYIVPLHKDCFCQIFARRCRINGSIIAKNAKLKIPLGLRTEFDVPDCALNLVNAEVRGSIMLQPKFCADGGVDMRGARVSRDIWAEAAKFIALDKIAFGAESLQCDGIVALRGKQGAPCMVQGGIDFLGATIGFLDLRGIHVSKSSRAPDDEKFVLRLELARVKGDLRLSYKNNKAIVNGHIDAFNLRVGGDLTLDYLNTASNHLTTSIDLTSSHVEGNLNSEKTFFLGIKEKLLVDGHMEGNPSMEKTVAEAPDKEKYGLVARNITIGNDCKLEALRGSVSLELSRIGGALVIRAEELADLNAKEAEVRGSVTASGMFRPRTNEQSLCFDGGRYLSGFNVGESELPLSINPEFMIASNSSFQNGQLIPILSIEDAHIDNDFRVEGIKVVPRDARNKIPFVVVSLRGLKSRVFHHDPKNSWGDNTADIKLKLKLDGFEYDRVDTEAVSRERVPLEAHIDWLSLQRNDENPNDYEPQPYEQLARALRNDGRFEDAKHITLQKLLLERQTMDRGLTRVFFLFMEKFFNHGLFPGKSVTWFVLSLFVGTVFFHIANHQGSDKPVLVLHSPAVSTLALPATIEADGSSVGMERTLKSEEVALQAYDNTVFERSCGDEVDSFWYALDVFVPLLDLNQEDKCTITMRKDGLCWRIFSNAYEIWGAIVTPIMLLSVTGLLRRYVEK
jgi:hypothetical protein